MQELALWSEDYHEKVVGSATTTREKLVNELKAVGITVI